ncbi:LuxR C-terminal-related transcriptional regulator [Streptomyces sp. NBC_00289]|uniref:helix-turn-helix transcriptional regulator n=1 Tax=Streptomyces sp. NBC_00289 TaxID=2975703 RepID=UPI003252E2A4
MRSRVARWPLAGRDTELTDFATAWGDRRYRGVVVFGPAGVGKSRLAEEFLAQAVGEGWKAGRATASATAAEVPLGAIAHLIPPGIDLSDPVSGFAEVARSLVGPERRRWVLLIDDLHLLDSTSAVLLRQLLDAGVIRLIGTVRSGEPVREAVDALTGGDAVHRIDLSTFDQKQAEVLLQAALGRPVKRRALRELHTAAGGNVLYLRELVVGALEAGSLASDGEIWELAGDWRAGTPRLAELIGVRLAAVGEGARSVLELLSVCGPVSLMDAEAVAGPVVLTDLEEAGIVQIDTDRRRTTLQLAHPLYGEIIRADIPHLVRRRTLLQQVQRAESRGTRRRDDALHIASWRLAATGTADPALLLQAAGLARHAHDYEQVIVLIDAVPESCWTAQTRLLLGEALWELGRWERADAVLADADSVMINEDQKISLTITRMLNLQWMAGRSVQALAVAEAARMRVTSAAGQELLRIAESYILVVSGQPARGLALLEDIDSLAKDARYFPDIHLWLMGASTRSLGLSYAGRTSEALTWAERAYSVHLELEDQTLAPHPATQLTAQVLALTESGRLAEARIIGEKAVAELSASRAPVRPVQVWASFLLGRVEWLAGHAFAARRWWAEAAALARNPYPITPLRLVLAGLAASTAVLGDLDAAEQFQTEAMACQPTGSFAGEDRLGEAWLLASRGQLTQARIVLAEAVQDASDSGYATSEALLLTDLARLGGPKSVSDRLFDLAAGCDGAFAPARARLVAALASGRAEQLLAVAGELEEIGADLLAAEAAMAAAAAARQTGQTRRAAAAGQQAQSCAARCQGARTPLLATTETVSPLTAREREIALLAAHGTPSKDIADTLHLSVRTVDNHLHHAYTKLGVTTRRELANALGHITGRSQTIAAPNR